jgi:MFS family permease
LSHEDDRGAGDKQPVLSFFALQASSDFATQIGSFAIPYIGLQMFGGSALLTALMTFSLGLPYLVLSTAAGSFVDRHHIKYSFRLSLPARMMASVICFTCLFYFSERDKILLIIILMTSLFMVGAGSMLFDLGLYAAITRCFLAGRLYKVNSQIMSATSLSLFVVPSLSSVLISLLGVSSLYIADAVLLVFCTPLVMKISDRSPIEHPPHVEDCHENGTKYIIRHKQLIDLAIATVIAKLFVRIGNVVFVLAASLILHLSSIVVGGLIAMTGVGVLLSAWSGPKLIITLGLRRTVSMSLIASGGAWSLIWVAYLSAGHWLPLAEIATGNVIFGFGASLFNSTSATLKQQITESKYQATVQACFQTIGWISLLTGTLVGGVSATYLGIQSMFIVASLGILAACLAFMSEAGSRLFGYCRVSPKATQ